MAKIPRLPAADSEPGYFYLFMGLHSLLIGLLPFFLPVYLWQRGLALPGLSLLIGMSGLTFVLALGMWQRIAERLPLKHLISLGLLFEILLLITTALLSETPGSPLLGSTTTHTPAGASDSVGSIGATGSMELGMLLAAGLLGLVNGLYNAFFWTTQRALFLSLLGNKDAGRQYGNFQIFVMIVLKSGILLGGLLLETGGIVCLLALSAGCAMVGNQYLAGRSGVANRRLYRAHASHRRVTLAESLRYRDGQGSQPCFVIDGVFLYLESHFWTLTLFLIVREDFSRLGIAVVTLAVIFSLLFLMIKNRIDRLPVRQLFRLSVWLYLGSWLLRFTLDGHVQGFGLWSTLILITFSSSFFRLAFNKRFFDMARRTEGQRYLLIKSYSSQFWLGLAFLSLAALMSVMPIEQSSLLQWLYLPAAALCPIYLRYSPQALGTSGPST